MMHLEIIHNSILRIRNFEIFRMLKLLLVCLNIKNGSHCYLLVLFDWYINEFSKAWSTTLLRYFIEYSRIRVMGSSNTRNESRLIKMVTLSRNFQPIFLLIWIKIFKLHKFMQQIIEFALEYKCWWMDELHTN